MKHHSYGSRSRVVSIAAAAWLSISGLTLASTPPYPQSQIITGATWDFTTVNTLRKASGSDLWPTTWAADGNLYGAWGDGGGFDGDSNNIGRVSLGFAVITGTPVPGQPSSYAGRNVWGEAPAYAQYPATFGGKVDDLLSVDGVMYGQASLWTAANCDCSNPVLKGGANPASHTLVWSANLGRTWQIAPWNAAADLGASLQYGRDYAGAADPDHVYYYYQGNLATDSSHVYLRRVARNAITADPATPGHFEYLSRLDESGIPTWSALSSDAVPVFTDPNMAAGTYANAGVVYDTGVERYLLVTSHGNATGQVGLFEAAQPWGPWSTVAYYDDWGGFNESAGAANGLSFPTKWISGEGLTLWGVFSGKTNGFDSFNVAKVVLSTQGGPPPPSTLTSEVGSWAFNEGTGSVTDDSSGKGSPGRLVNGPMWTRGESGDALSFDGARAAVEIPGSTSVANLYRQGLTAAAWIKPRTGTTGGRILGKLNGTAGWQLKMNRGSVQFTGHFSERSAIRYGSSETTLNEWQHVAVTWDGTTDANDVHLYVNGALIDGAFLNGAGEAGADSGVPFTIGNAADFEHGFNGVIDGVQVFDRVLSATEIRSLAAGVIAGGR